MLDSFKFLIDLYLRFTNFLGLFIILVNYVDLKVSVPLLVAPNHRVPFHFKEYFVTAGSESTTNQFHGFQQWSVMSSQKINTSITAYGKLVISNVPEFS